MLDLFISLHGYGPGLSRILAFRIIGVAGIPRVIKNRSDDISARRQSLNAIKAVLVGLGGILLVELGFVANGAVRTRDHGLHMGPNHGAIVLIHHPSGERCAHGQGDVRQHGFARFGYRHQRGCSGIVNIVVEFAEKTLGHNLDQIRPGFQSFDDKMAVQVGFSLAKVKRLIRGVHIDDGMKNGMACIIHHPAGDPTCAGAQLFHGEIDVIGDLAFQHRHGTRPGKITDIRIILVRIPFRPDAHIIAACGQAVDLIGKSRVHDGKAFIIIPLFGYGIRPGVYIDKAHIR
ncbi:MAG: hypothetical protein BWY83_01257 [bacterium ADurb.Bin478]|nr:MAG: hypothetical protein BWY83_01257 [bacterium ADurb.Bin478]